VRLYGRATDAVKEEDGNALPPARREGMLRVAEILHALPPRLAFVSAVADRLRGGRRRMRAVAPRLRRAGRAGTARAPRRGRAHARPGAAERRGCGRPWRAHRRGGHRQRGGGAHRPADPRGRAAGPHRHPRLRGLARAPARRGLPAPGPRPPGDAQLRGGGGPRGGGREDPPARRVDPRPRLARGPVDDAARRRRPRFSHAGRAQRRLAGEPRGPEPRRRARRPRQRAGHGAARDHPRDAGSRGRRDRARCARGADRRLRRQRHEAGRAAGALPAGAGAGAGAGHGRVRARGRHHADGRGSHPRRYRPLPQGGRGGAAAQPALRDGRGRGDDAGTRTAARRAGGRHADRAGGEALRRWRARLPRRRAAPAVPRRPGQLRPAGHRARDAPGDHAPGARSRLPGGDARDRRPRQPHRARRLRTGAGGGREPAGPTFPRRARAGPRPGRPPPLPPARRARLVPGHPLPVGPALGGRSARPRAPARRLRLAEPPRQRRASAQRDGCARRGPLAHPELPRDRHPTGRKRAASGRLRPRPEADARGGAAVDDERGRLRPLR